MGKIYLKRKWHEKFQISLLSTIRIMEEELNLNKTQKLHKTDVIHDINLDKNKLKQNEQLREEDMINSSVYIQQRQPNERFTSSKTVYHINTVESYSAPTKTETVSIDSRNKEEGEEKIHDEEPHIMAWKALEDQKLLNLYK